MLRHLALIFLLAASGALAVGAHGVITGIANFFPRVILQLYDLYKQGKLAEATKLQGEVSAAEWAILGNGIPSAKVASRF